MTYFVILNSLKDEKKAKVLDAGLEMFIRFGFRRTTMGDIAQAAEMSRPAVYLVYPNKEEIFRGVVIRSCEEFRALATKRVEAAGSLAEKLWAVMEPWVVEPYKVIARSPEAEELYELAYSFASDIKDQATALYEGQLAEVIGSSPEVDPDKLRERELSVELVARLLALSTLELKRPVESLVELKRLLKATVRIYVAVLSE